MEGDHVFALPYASCLSTFQAPGWGIPAVFPPHRWRNATPWELVPFSHRSASRIFITQPGCSPPLVVTRDSDHQLLGGEEQAGLRSWSLTKHESPRVKVTSEVSVSRRRRSPLARSALLSGAPLAQLKRPLGRSSTSRGQG